MNRYCNHTARQAGKIAQKSFAVLSREHADNQNQRPRDTLLKIGERASDYPPAVGIMATVEPEFTFGWQQ